MCVESRKGTIRKPKFLLGAYQHTIAIDLSTKGVDITLVNMRSHKDSWKTQGIHQFISQVSTIHHLHQQKKMRFCSWCGKYKLPYYFSRKAVFTKSSKITMAPSIKKKRKKKKNKKIKQTKNCTKPILWQYVNKAQILMLNDPFN